MKPIGASIGMKFGIVVLMTVVTVGVAGYLAGEIILEKVASLARDDMVLESLTDGQKSLVEWNRERRARVEGELSLCHRRGEADCRIARVDVTVSEAPGAVTGWESERNLVVDFQGKTYRYTFDWPELKPRYQKITDVIGTRMHVSTLLPGLTESFLKVFAFSLVGAGLLGLAVTFGLSRRLRRRVEALVEYTRRIASGALLPAPALTQGRDEVGLLADAMHDMAGDLDEARQKLILTEKMASWQNVAKKVAHEIKNPLTPISLVSTQLTQLGSRIGGPDGEIALEAGRILAEETASLGRMVKEFTAFARLPAPELKQGDLLTHVRDFVTRNGDPSGERPELMVEAEEGDYPVIMDPGMISQIFHNLVNNARLAKAPERVTVRFRLSRNGEGDTFDCDVVDDGPGIPESLRATLFDAYVTSRSTGDGEKGMGLGLAISRKIAVDHGGSLSVTETSAKGTTFRLRMPPAGLGVAHREDQ